jgi:hypothetical protein
LVYSGFGLERFHCSTILLYPDQEFSESEEEAEHCNKKESSMDSISVGSPYLRLPGSDDDEVVCKRPGSGCSSFTTESGYSNVLSEISEDDYSKYSVYR